MRNDTVRRSVVLFGVFFGLVMLGHAGCGDGDEGPGAAVASASCGSCQEAFTEEDCQKWGDLAGCETSELEPEGTCSSSFAGCAFTNCKGSPICNDEGSSSCASKEGSLTQENCDALAAEAGCDSATTAQFSVNGNPVTGCDFLGCDFDPSCD